MKKLFTLASLLVLASLVLAACGTAKADNLLDDIKNRGYILVSTDPNYAPSGRNNAFSNAKSSRRNGMSPNCWRPTVNAVSM